MAITERLVWVWVWVWVWFWVQVWFWLWVYFWLMGFGHWFWLLVLALAFYDYYYFCLFVCFSTFFGRMPVVGLLRIASLLQIQLAGPSVSNTWRSKLRLWSQKMGIFPFLWSLMPAMHSPSLSLSDFCPFAAMQLGISLWGWSMLGHHNFLGGTLRNLCDIEVHLYTCFWLFVWA